MASAPPDEHTPLIGASPTRGELNIQISGIPAPLKRSRSDGSVRQPYSYENRAQPSTNADEHGMALRAQYYSRLEPTPASRFTIPDHIVPSEFFSIYPQDVQEHGHQRSIVTIFSIWNTMMGTSILSMPWAIHQAGFATGILFMVFLATLASYTAYRVLSSKSSVPNRVVMEFNEVCKFHLGIFGEMASIVFSFAALLGAAIVYWVLMSNFLYHIVAFIHVKIEDPAHHHDGDSTAYNVGYWFSSGHNASHDVLCENPIPIHNHSGLSQFHLVGGGPASNGTSMFHRLWQQQYTVPFVLVPFLGSLVNFKSAKVFANFNAAGTVSVLFILIIVVMKAVQWGVHVDFVHAASPEYAAQFHWHFPALTGMLSLAYFIHNCIISIMRNQKYPENNTRDLTIAYFLVMTTYLTIGIVFYVSFPLPKYCIADNLLNNFHSDDPLALAARCFLFLQMTTVFPLLMYLLRIQFMIKVFKDVYPSRCHILVMNAVVISICVIFAVFLPKIGTIIRFVGALSGLAYVFTLPSLVHMCILYSTRQLTATQCGVHCTIIALGLANFISQFTML